MSVSVVSASEISINDSYSDDSSSMDLISIDEDIGSDSSNNLSIYNVDANLDENPVGADGLQTTINAPNF